MKNQRAKCPHCDKVCNSKAGMTTHINMMHLVMSPSQKEQAAKEMEESLSCEVCGHWVSMHGDNEECYSCEFDKCHKIN